MNAALRTVRNKRQLSRWVDSQAQKKVRYTLQFSPALCPEHDLGFFRLRIQFMLMSEDCVQLSRLGSPAASGGRPSSSVFVSFRRSR